MDEADNILINQLKQIGIDQTKLDAFDAKSFISAVIACFDRISKMLVESENFIDMKFLKSHSLNEQTGKFKVCQKFVEYLKNLEYLHDLSFNSFLYPNIKDTRRLLSFLFEFLFKGEGESSVGQAKAEQERPTNEQKVL